MNENTEVQAVPVRVVLRDKLQGGRWFVTWEVYDEDAGVFLGRGYGSDGSEALERAGEELGVEIDSWGWNY